MMVCMDGFILTHAYDRVDIPTQAQVDAYLPPFQPRQILDPADPVTIGALVGPRRSPKCATCGHHKQLRALTLIPKLAAEFSCSSSGAVRAASSAPTAPRTRRRSSWRLGSVIGTVQEVVDEMRDAGAKIGSVSICSFRPFPIAVLREALQNAQACRRAGEMPRGRPGRHRLRRRAQIVVGHPAQQATRSSRDWAAGRSPAARCGSCSTTRSPTSSSR